MRILLADDHTLFRAGLKALLEMEVAEAKIVGEAANGLEAVSLATLTKQKLRILPKKFSCSYWEKIVKRRRDKQ